MPRIREIVEIPEDARMDEASFIEAHEELGAMVGGERRQPASRARNAIEDAVKSKANCAQPEVDVLELATSRLHCTYCNPLSTVLYHPGILAHSCLRTDCRPQGHDSCQHIVLLIEEGRDTAKLGHLDSLVVAEVSDAAKNIISSAAKIRGWR